MQNGIKVDSTANVTQSTTKVKTMEKGDNGTKRRRFSNVLRNDLEGYCPASNLAFNEHIKEQIKLGKTVYHFGFGQAPFPIMPGMVKALQDHAGENAYLPVAGIVELRTAICEFHKRFDRLIDISPDQVVVAPGTKELIFLIMAIFNGDVLVISPTWTTYRPQSHLAGRQSFVVNATYEDQWRVTPEAIEKVVKENKMSENKLLILCNPDNPTGISYEAEHLKALSDVCRRHNIIVLSDEIYARLHFQQKHDTLARYYPEGTILSAGMSKWASAGGWRLGYHIYPPELSALMDAVKSAASHTYSCAPAPMQYAVAEALANQEDCQDYILHTTRILEAIANYCHKELTSIGVKMWKSTAGYYLFPNCEILREPLKKRGITTCAQMCDALLNEASVALMAGGPAFLRPEDEFTTRVCYVNFDGKEALDASRKIGLDVPLTEEFVQNHASPTYKGIQALKHWIEDQLRK